MPRLQDKLDAMAASSAETYAGERYDTMKRGTEALTATGQAELAIGLGAAAPAFALVDSQGATVRSEELLARGPLVLTFFRGHW